MGRKRNFTISESLKDLKGYKSKITNYHSSERLDALILLKSKKYETLPKVAAHLDIHPRTLDRWIKRYTTEGLENFLGRETREKPSKLITPKIHGELEKKLQSSENPFSGYVEVQEWLLKEHNVEIQYQWLWKYMTTKLGSVLKVPRKTNIKKEEGAEDSFFKTAQNA